MESREVRVRLRFFYALLRGVPAVVAAALHGELRFTWAMEASSTPWQDTSDPKH